MHTPLSHTKDAHAPEAPEQGADFSYTYSARQRREIESIRSKYIPAEENKMEQLRRLDRSAERQGLVFAIPLGVLSMMFLGIGMTLTMVYTDYFLPGLVIGVAGIAGMALAYPLYRRITEKNRKKIAPQILRLSEELINGGK